jgi:addiction module HigA family antidote
MTRMFNPPHPGLALRDDVLPALRLTVTEAAKQLGVSRVMFSRVINGKAGISADMALRLEAWLKTPNGGGPTATSFLRMQADYDLWQAEHSPRRPTTIVPAAALSMA